MKKVFGECSLCSKYSRLTFEHIPPKSAFNANAIYTKKRAHLFDKSSYFYGKTIRLNQGYGLQVFCKSCNNNTGDWYANDFSNFAHQGLEIIKRDENLGKVIRGRYHIKPMNIIKQVFTMFLALDRMGYLKSYKDLVEFVLNRNSTQIPKKFNVYMFSTLSSTKRMIGYTFCASPNIGNGGWSEINFPPFGFILTDGCKPPKECMVDITEFGLNPLDKKIAVDISTPYLEVESPIIGIYKEN